MSNTIKENPVKPVRKKKKKKSTLSWKTVIKTFVYFSLPACCFILYAIHGIDAGTWGGEPGYVSGTGPMVWIVDRLYLVIILAILGSAFSLILFFYKMLEVIKIRLKRD